MRMLIVAILALCVNAVHAQQEILYFGTFESNGNVQQARFVWRTTGTDSSLFYAPYGRTPITLKSVQWKQQAITMTWPSLEGDYSCALEKSRDTFQYTGVCANARGGRIKIVLREFNVMDAALQGNMLKAGQADIAIIDRAMQLLNDGRNWDSTDNRVCDQSEYPYKWSLFCALHQASIDVDGEYRHLRPAVRAVRKAIEQLKPGVQYAHMLQDYNNESRYFIDIHTLLEHAKIILRNEIR